MLIGAVSGFGVWWFELVLGWFVWLVDLRLSAFGVSCWLVCTREIVWCVMYVSYGFG